MTNLSRTSATHLSGVAPDLSSCTISISISFLRCQEHHREVMPGDLYSSDEDFNPKKTRKIKPKKVSTPGSVLPPRKPSLTQNNNKSGFKTPLATELVPRIHSSYPAKLSVQKPGAFEEMFEDFDDFQIPDLEPQPSSSFSLTSFGSVKRKATSRAEVTKSKQTTDAVTKSKQATDSVTKSPQAKDAVTKSNQATYAATKSPQAADAATKSKQAPEAVPKSKKTKATVTKSNRAGSKSILRFCP